FSGNLTYTEPITEQWSTILNYGISLSNNQIDRKSFNKTGADSYNQLDSLFSNKFKFDQTSHQGGVAFNYKKDKTTFNFGTNISAVDFNQKDLFKNNDFKRSFVNWVPKARYQY